MSFKWFTKSSEAPNGVSANERFTERLNNVWFNFDRKSRFHPGRMIKGVTRLGKFLTDLNERVLKLEQAAKPTQPSSMNRTATGVADMNANWRLPKYDPPVEVAVINRDERVLLRSVRKFRENNSIVSFVYLDGLQIEIKRDPNV